MTNFHQKAARYLDALLKQAESVEKPGLHHVTVSHDGWCNLLAGRGPCNCNPDVSRPIPHTAWKDRN